MAGHPPEYTGKIKVYDKLGFHYEGEIHHCPWFGFSTLYYLDSPIGQVEYNKMREPIGDDDQEWEMYWERYGEWSDAAISDLKLKFEEFVNKDWDNTIKRLF